MIPNQKLKVMKGIEIIIHPNEKGISKNGSVNIIIEILGINKRSWGDNHIPNKHIKNPHPEVIPKIFPIYFPFDFPYFCSSFE
ncbi:MAG: hypothetical protein P8Y70_00555 [Candidatus Lokiarchaeota archaeon]